MANPSKNFAKKHISSLLRPLAKGEKDVPIRHTQIARAFWGFIGN